MQEKFRNPGKTKKSKNGIIHKVLGSLFTYTETSEFQKKERASALNSPNRSMLEYPNISKVQMSYDNKQLT